MHEDKFRIKSLDKLHIIQGVLLLQLKTFNFQFQSNQATDIKNLGLALLL